MGGMVKSSYLPEGYQEEIKGNMSYDPLEQNHHKRIAACCMKKGIEGNTQLCGQTGWDSVKVVLV